MPVTRSIAIILSLAITLSAQTQRPANPGAAAPAKSRSAKPGPVRQTIVDPSVPFPLDSIKVTGNNQFSETEILRLSGIQKGQRVLKQDFDAAQARLLESGLFETVAYRYEPLPGKQSYSAVFEVKEIAQLFPYRFEAIDFPEAELRAWLKKDEPLFGDRIPATEPVLKRFQASIDKYLASKNKPSPIAGKLLPDAKGEFQVVFLPSTLPAVAQVRFMGNKALSTVALQQGITGAGIGALYTENRFRQILDASIRPLYEAQGYLRVAFPKIETVPASDVRGVDAIVHVQEGDVYKLRDVTLTGEMADNTKLLKDGGFRTNEVVDMKAAEEGAGRMERSLRRRGFLNAKAAIERKVDDKAKVVDLVINMDPGPQYRMGKLEIAGLDITTEPHVRKMWVLKEKAPFDFEYPDIFLGEMPEVLDNLGKTRSTLKPDPGTLMVDVILTFTPPEKKPKDERKRPDNTGTSGGPVQFPLLYR